MIITAARLNKLPRGVKFGVLNEFASRYTFLFLNILLIRPRILRRVVIDKNVDNDVKLVAVSRFIRLKQDSFLSIALACAYMNNA